MKQDIVIPITQNGYDLTQQRLDRLLNIERPRIIQLINKAKALGDLSDNADYNTAREEQANNEGSIEASEKVLKSSLIIDPNVIARHAGNTVAFGAVITILVNGEEKITRHIVGETEDHDEVKISWSSKEARALVLKNDEPVTVGDIVEISPERKYEILKIEYPLS